MRDDMVDVLAATIPDSIDLNDDRRATQFVCELAGVAGYTLSQVAARIDAVLERAAELRRERANV